MNGQIPVSAREPQIDSSDLNHPKVMEMLEAINQLKVYVARLEEKYDGLDNKVSDIQQQMNLLASDYREMAENLVRNQGTSSSEISSGSTKPGTNQSHTISLNFPTYGGEEEPTGWIYRVEKYFMYHQTPATQRILIASFHLTGKALQWYMLMEAAKSPTSWESFVDAITTHFGTTGFEDPISSLVRFRQQNSVSEYQETFEALLNKIEGLTEEFVTSCFVSGLKDEIRYNVQMFKPSSISAAMGLARMQEDKLATRKKGSFEPSDSLSSFSSPATSPIKRLNINEMHERRKKELCCNCDDEFAPGHKCKTRHLLLLDTQTRLEAPKANKLEGIVRMEPEVSQFDAYEDVTKVNEIEHRFTSEGQDFLAYEEVYESFNDMGLNDNLLRGIYAYGYEKPSAIQQRGIVPFCKGLDVIQQAQSGSGNTTTFCSGILQQLDCGLAECQALVLSPIRQLAQRIKRVMQELGGYLGVKAHACVGGTSVREDQRILRTGVHVVVGTPGRVFDMLRRKALRPDYIKMFVLDDADEMLSCGFKDQIHEIFQLLPRKIQVALFSPTLYSEVIEFSQKFMKKPVRILAKHDELALEGIKQFHINFEREEEKLLALCDLFEMMAIKYCVIFVNTPRKVDWLTDKMRSRAHSVYAAHNNMDLSTLETSLHEFYSGSFQILIATDHLARIIDMRQTYMSINYDLPTQPKNYLNHIGRSQRFHKTGAMINFVTSNDAKALSDIQKYYSIVIEEFSLKNCPDFL